ncbi:MAG: alanine/glycine:cation symporter family protein [Actinomycetaceae bacterium]|nr:alanine/glycine:cation symporter family protein [Actinomycetaceae bacterium]MDU0970264.1 alanine/glycine:cation symporter family protein [Actinomycetaceae bacterium]
MTMPLATAIAVHSENAFENWNNQMADVLDNAYSHSIAWVLIVVLLGVGLYFTVVTRGVQIRMFPQMLRVVFKSRKGSRGGISSFQAFAIGVADRVGTGNIAGVALAIVAGGAGAIFWMWIVALVGMATAFIESTLAQVFKIRNADGTFRGGPAYFIQRGLGSRAGGIIFAILLIFAYGFSFQMIQANTLAQVAQSSFNVQPWVSAIILLLLTAPFFLGGVRPVARLAEFLAPMMACAYLLIAIAVVVKHHDQIGPVFASIFSGAFGMREATGGTAAGLLVALEQGTKRGLFSNEAGMGSAPNAAATATVRHPVTQGLIQSLGVFVDTMIVCSCTAFIVLVGGIYKPGQTDADVSGAALTTQSVGTLGDWTPALMFVIIAAFAYSTLLGNYTYAEGNIKYLLGIDNNAMIVKILCIISVGLGAILPLKAAWSIADWATAFMAIVNLVAICLLSKWALGALRDWEHQGKNADESYFCSTDNPFLPGELHTHVWDAESVAADRAHDLAEAGKPHPHREFTEELVENDF